MESRPFHQDLLHTLSPVGRALFSRFGRGPTIDCPFKCIHHAFEFHSRNQPDAIAVEDGQVKITYAELDRQANCLANHLRAMGVASGSRVGVLVERSIYMVIGIFAVLKAGGAYIPLDGNVISKHALTHALRDSYASVVLVQRKFAERVVMTPTLCIEDSICPRYSPAHCVKPEDISAGGDSAYIIYTSGTIGDPCGVDVMHRNVTNLICIAPGNLAMGPGLRIAQLMNISFDMAAWEILGSLCNGSTLCLRGKTSKEWRAVMKTVDVVIATPSMLAPHDPTDYPNIKVVAVAGEHCPKRLADAWAQTVDFYNCCGPTEVTIVNTMHLHNTGENMGIGAPTPNNTVYLLDEQMNPVKIGDVGIVWAGGAGITRGYVNLPNKTAERYKRDPFLGDGSMMFNTGDLGRWHPDGDLEHLGRVDHQVKIKGFKVELDSVAAAMETTPGIKSAVAILIEGELWGFYTPSNIEIETVRASVTHSLPHYGVPTKYLPLNKFPTTANGKTDKKALQELAIKSPEYIPPSPIPTAPTPSNQPKPYPVYPLLIDADKRPQVEKEWNTSAGSTKRFTPDATQDHTPIPSTPPPLPPKSSRRLPTRKDTITDQSLEVSHIPFPTIPGSSPWDKVTVNNNSLESIPEKEWDNQSVESVMTTPTWSNGSCTTIDTATCVGTVVSLPLKKEIGPSSLEDQTSIWADYEQEVLPEMTQGPFITKVRYQIANFYRRLFGLVFLINFCIFLAATSRHASALEISRAVIGNLFLAVIMRQDYIVNAFVLTFTSIPRHWPLSVRRIAAQIYQVEALHSGAGSSAVLWFIYFTGQATKEAAEDQGGTSTPTAVITWFILAVFLTMLVFTYPKIRTKFRHSFETIHRFSAWGVILLLWVQIPLLTNDYRDTDQPLHKALRQSSSFWLLLLMTVSLALPWVKLKKVNVYCKHLSSHAVRLYFDYITPHAGSFVKISDDPLVEWHSFAAIPEPGKPGFSVVINRGGDWTSNQVANPPIKIWVRGVPTYSVMRIASMFRRIVLVTTGSGIGCCTPAILAQELPIRLLWTAPDIRETFGDSFVDSILEANPEAIIYNTRHHGEPDMVKLTYRLVKDFDAEAVIIISNKIITEKVVYGMVSRGIPAFGSSCIT